MVKEEIATVKATLDKPNDVWKISVVLSDKGKALLEEFAITPKEGKDYPIYSYKLNSVYGEKSFSGKRYLVRSGLTRMFNIDGQMGIFFDKKKINDRNNEREILTFDAMKVEKVIDDIKTMFRFMLQQEAVMKKEICLSIFKVEKGG